MTEPEIRQFLSHLALNQRVTASTQTVALSALLVLYRDVKRNLKFIDQIERAKRPRRLPVVFTRGRNILAHLSGTYLLLASLLCGPGLRLMEALRLRVKDLELTMKNNCSRRAMVMRSRRRKRFVIRRSSLLMSNGS